MPKYTFEIGGKTYDIESDRQLSDAELGKYAQMLAPQPAAPQIPGAGPYQAPQAQEVPMGRRMMEGAQRNIGQMAQALQPSAEALGAAGGAIRGAQVAAPFAPMAGPFAPVVPLVGGVLGGAAGYSTARGTARAAQGQAPDVGGGLVEGGVGEVVGRAAAPVVAPVVKALAKPFDYLRTTAERTATKIAQQAAGTQRPDIVQQLRAAAAEGSALTPAQVTAEVPRAPFQALLARGAGTDDAIRAAQAQVAEAEANLAALAGGGNQTAARQAVEQARAQLNELTAPMRQAELGAANQAQQVINRLAPQAAQRQASMVNALQQAGRTGTEAAQRAESAVQQLQREVPGQIPALSARQAARTQAAASRQWQETSDTFAQIASQRRAERDFLENQIGSLEKYGLRPLDVNPILQSIDTAMNAPGLRASPTLNRVMGVLRDDFAALAAKGGGTIDAHDLYTLRKEGVAQRVQDVLQQTDPKIGAKITNTVLQQLKPLIDDAIEKAGGTGWRQYLNTYSKGMDVINQRAMAAEALRLFKDSPEQYVRLVRGNNPDAVEAVFGPGRYDLFREMAEQMPTLDRIATRLEADKAALALAGKGGDELANILEANRPKLRLPNWFSPVITATNARLAKAEDKLNKKTLDLIRQASSSNQSMADLLEGVTAKEQAKLFKLLNSPDTWKAARAGAIAVGAEPARNALAPEQPANALAP